MKNKNIIVTKLIDNDKVFKMFNISENFIYFIYPKTIASNGILVPVYYFCFVIDNTIIYFKKRGMCGFSHNVNIKSILKCNIISLMQYESNISIFKLNYNKLKL